MMSNANYDAEDYGSDSADEWDAPIRGDIDAPAPRAPSVDVAATGGATGGDAAAPRGYRVAGMDAEERELAGAEVPVEFGLPDGTTWRYTFFMGHTVQYLKAQLEAHNKTQYPFEKTVLYLGDRVLLDPLSLNDLPFVGNETNRVRVEVKH